MGKPVVSKKYFSIKEVATLVEEPESTLRYWESEFQDVIAPRRNERGVRFYTEQDIEDVQLMKYLIRECGLTFEGVRRKLKNNKDTAVRHAKIVRHLKHIKVQLKILVETMDEVEKNKLNQVYS